eukprot:1054356-Prymnesium_polylepis.1
MTPSIVRIECFSSATSPPDAAHSLATRAQASSPASEESGCQSAASISLSLSAFGIDSLST